MRFALDARFGICEDVRDVPDPWGFGATFGVLRYDSREHQEWLKKKQQEDPILRGAMVTVLKDQFSASEKPAAEDAAAAFQTKFESAYKAAAVATLDKPDANPFDLLRRKDGPLNEALSLLKRWKGLKDENGVDVMHNQQTATALLTSDTQIPEGEYGAGLDMGEALVQYILEESKKSDAYRTKLLEATAKNSEPSSAGSEA